MGGLGPDLRLEVGQFSHQGRQRANNEDWLGAFQPDDTERLASHGALFLVADGMGGHQSGELASRQAVDRVINHYVRDRSDDVATSLAQAFELANASLYREAVGKQGRGRAGTTLLAAVVRRGELWIGNVGDSRAYLLRDGKLHQLSRDHSWAAQLGAAPGRPSAARHLITRALGLKPEVEVDLFPPIPLRGGDRLLLCTDGLTTPLTDLEIGAIAARYPPQQAANELVRAANERGGPDNVSVIVVELTERESHLAGQAAVTLLSSLLRPATWVQAATDLRTLLAGQGRGWPPAMFALVMCLVVLGIIGLGFALGWVLFR